MINYSEIIKGLPLQWASAKGKNIKIGILDTGVATKHPDLHNILSNAIAIKDFTNSPSGPEDIKGHGTHCLGFMGAKTINESFGINGLAPEAQYFIAKIKSDNDGMDIQHIISALEEGLNNGVQIFNLSLSLGPRTKNLKKLSDLITEASGKNVIFVAAARNNESLLSDLYYPARLAEAVAVGAVDQNFVNSNPSLQFTPKLNFILPFNDLLSCSLEKNNWYHKEKGSSMCTAIVTGISAALMSAKPNTTNYSTLLNELASISIKYSDSIDLTSDIKIIKP